MKSSEIQKKTGLTRKAIEYYEEKGLIKPCRDENNYRIYNNNDLEKLKKIYMYKRFGLDVVEIRDILQNKDMAMNAIRKIEIKSDMESEKLKLFKEFLAVDKNNVHGIKNIENKLKTIEMKDSIYEKLCTIFPGYFGQMIFLNYTFFMDDIVDDYDAFEKYIDFIDSLPQINFTEDEILYIESTANGIDMSFMESVAKEKYYSVKNFDKWYDENIDIITQYLDYKSSEEYLNSPIYNIEKKIRNYMDMNNYYEIAIPLIRRFSRKYDAYYKDMLDANEKLKLKLNY